MDIDDFGQASGQKPEMMNQRLVIKWNMVQFVTLFISNAHVLKCPFQSLTTI